MRKTEFPFLLFGAFFVLTIPFGSDMATAVVPGWHITVATPHFLATVIISISLLLVAIGYRKLINNKNRVSLLFVFFHALLTIPLVLFIRSPLLVLTISGPDLNLPGRQVTFATTIVGASFVLFIAGLVLFGIYFLRNTYFKTRQV